MKDQFSIVLVEFPFSEKYKHKKRPALVLSEARGKYDEYILAYITTKQDIDKKDSNLVLSVSPTKETGLAQKSFIRLYSLISMPKEQITQKIGILPVDMQRSVLEKISIIFNIK